MGIIQLTEKSFFPIDLSNCGRKKRIIHTHTYDRMTDKKSTSVSLLKLVDVIKTMFYSIRRGGEHNKLCKH